MPRLHDVIDTIETNIRRLNVVASDDISHDLKDKLLGEISVLDFIYSCIIENTTRVMVIAGDRELAGPLIKSVRDLPDDDVTNDPSIDFIMDIKKPHGIYSMTIIDPTDSIIQLCREVYQFDREDAGSLPNDILLDDISCNAYSVAHRASRRETKIIIMNFNVRDDFVNDMSKLSEWTKLIFKHVKLG